MWRKKKVPQHKDQQHVHKEDDRLHDNYYSNTASKFPLDEFNFFFFGVEGGGGGKNWFLLHKSSGCHDRKVGKLITQPEIITRQLRAYLDASSISDATYAT